MGATTITTFPHKGMEQELKRHLESQTQQQILAGSNGGAIPAGQHKGLCSVGFTPIHFTIQDFLSCP